MDTETMAPIWSVWTNSYIWGEEWFGKWSIQAATKDICGCYILVHDMGDLVVERKMPAAHGNTKTTWLIAFGFKCRQKRTSRKGTKAFALCLHLRLLSSACAATQQGASLYISTTPKT